MTAPRPKNHPGDFAWRLPLLRTLQQANAITQEQSERAQTATKDQGGFFISHLLAEGLPETKLLVAWGKATGLPTAPAMVLRKPNKDLAAPFTAELALELRAVPFLKDEQGLHVAFAVPLPANVTSQLPAHVAHVALERDVETAIEYFWPGSTTTEEAPLPFVSPSHFGNPTELDFKRAGLTVTTGPSQAEVAKPQLKKLGLIAGGVVAALLLVKAGAWVIDRSQREIEDKSQQLGKGLVAAQQEAAKARERELAVRQGETNLYKPTEGQAVDLGTALQNANLAEQKRDAAGFASACRDVASALNAAKSQTTVRMQMADFANLERETNVLCEAELTLPDPRWADLRSRIMRVQSGDAPREGPRYQLDEPAAVTKAKSEVDAALTAADVTGACVGVRRWRTAVSDWADRFPPGPRMVRMRETADNQVGDFLTSCGKSSVDEIKQRWAAFQRNIGPE